ncbi:cell surface protein SprA [Lewinella sp. JB7]|uniref:T9SS outer membrane translocon Sov/SprA n=1 Tax=Lewinella sp. JB7 TaxID=2962887 RepID=UPI0020CA0916|nr:cell surface protein SprA [Lewinella sp. JB7]MCP9234446.1 cell surface protein SprA [Lewinella sp. JB7]
MNKTLPLLCVALVSLSFTYVPYRTATDAAWYESGTYDPFLNVLTDTLPPLRDRQRDFITDPNTNPVDLQDPAAVEKTVEYDPATGRYIVRERLGDIDFRPPTYLTFDEYFEYRAKEDQRKYFNNLAGVGNPDESVNIGDPLADIEIDPDLVSNLFGGTEISIQPQGSVDLSFGLNYQYQDNPFIVERFRRNTIFDFDMDIQMNVTGQIGDKLKLNTNYNTGANFNFDNQIKLDYNSEAFGEDDIIRKIEAGDVSLPLRGTLIEGAQSLFGLKTELQFGHLRLTAIASQQRSQREKLTIEGGSQLAQFEVYADEYDENRHFFLSHYNREVYEHALENLPQIQTLFHLENIEVWITNDRNEVLDVRDIVAFADLAEPTRLTNPNAVGKFPTPRYQEICDGRPLPENGANDLYGRLVAEGENLRDIDRSVSVLQSARFGLEQIRDFEKVSARKLNPREYTVNPELGFISLNINVQPDQVVAVSYRYKYNGEIFKVGELSVNTDNSSTDTSNFSNQVLYTKLLKSSTQRVSEPAWDLMMKNVYSLGAYQVNQEDFRLDVQYENPGQGFQRFLPVDVDLPGGTFNPIPGVPLIRAFNLDRLNTQGDPQPDGVFDFVPGITINPATGRIYFPVLEPFGSDLAARLPPEVAPRFTYQELYDSTLFQAREYPEKNRFAIRGTYKSTVQSEISLGAFNIPPGSVRVTAGGALLVEGRDYTVDYSTGRVRVLNDAILSSGVPINVSFEDNTIFSLQTKTMLGLRADYEVNDNLAVGGTFMQLFERPFTQKVNIGEDPINNRIYGFDATFNKPSGWLTRTLDKLPFFSTNAPSNVSVTAETAILDPGHSKAINLSRTEKGGIVYLDDFEGTSSPIDLMTPVQRWYLASVPQNDGSNNNPLFPESTQEGLVSGANRASLSWYRIDQSARQAGAGDDQNVYTSRVPQQEVFPNTDLGSQRGLFQFFTFDLSYYPNERGPYNFDPPQGYPGFTAGALPDQGDPLVPVKLLDPKSRWGGIMREMTTTDFQSSNIEFIEFWMLSPFLDPTNPSQAAPDAREKQGTLYFNLGNVSEDILKDSRKFFENGLPTPVNPRRPVDQTVWSRVPVAQQITQGFDNDPESRRAQDVGLDGADDALERTQFADYLASFAGSPTVQQRLAEDVSNDNFYYFNSDRYAENTSLLTRYKNFNNTQGNSAANENTASNLRQSATNLPDDEDLNQDNTLNESESYFQYEIPLVQSRLNPRELDQETTPFITDRIEDPASSRIWYRFRVPLNTDDKTAVGGIQDFRSIRFMRMFLREFEAPVTLRFAEFELVRNSWRRYNRPFQTGPIIGGEDNTEFFVDAVNIEENSRRQPFNYVLPNGIRRENSIGIQSLLQNEQSLSLKVQNLQPSDSRAVFKYTDTDLRLYEELKMFVHAEATGQSRFERPEDGELRLFLRMGSDFEQNYYEYEVPLSLSDTAGLAGLNPSGTAYADSVWLPENEVQLPLEILTALKLERNGNNISSEATYEQQYSPAEGINHTIRIKGNPNLGFVKVFMIGVRNEKDLDNNGVSAEVWVNELRLEGLDERGGVAAVARADVQLADLGNLTAAVNYSSVGFGALDNSVLQRNRFSTAGYDLATNLSMDRFLPSKWGVRLPVYLQHSKQTSTPEYDPYDYDIKLKDKLQQAETGEIRDSIREQAQEINKITAVNLNNVGIAPATRRTKPSPLDPANFSVSYGYTKNERSDPYIQSEVIKDHTGALDYTFSRGQGAGLEPFKGIESKYLRLLSEFNLNLLPNTISITNVLNRSFSTTSYRFAGVDERFNTFFNKRFIWNRSYDVQWNLTRSLRLGFNANMNATIDEPDENELVLLPDQEAKDIRRDSIWSSLLDGGRPKQYNHTFNASYQLPLRFLPFLDFVDVRAQYLGNYSWAASPLLIQEKGLGNLIQNSQQRQLTADLNFERFYDQIPFLRAINQSARRRPTRRPGTTSDEETKEANKTTKALIRPLLALRRARLNYSEEFTTVIPGFLPEPNLFGLSDGWNTPGWGFVAGLQPTIRTLAEDQRQSDQDYLNTLAQDGYISDNPMLSQDVIQNYTKRWDANAIIEPFTDFRLELTMDRSFTENYTETFKVQDKGPNEPFLHSVPVRDGSLTFSNGGALSLFNQDTTSLNNLFATFEANRLIISQRRGGSTPHADPDLAAQGYSFGYGPNQQEVLLPAFLAAYRDEDPSTVNLDPFDAVGAPNWRLTWNGLDRIGGLSEIFRRVNITHGYQSSFSISSYGTSLDYLDAIERQTTPQLTGYDTVSLNYYPRIEIPNLSESKAFAPLLAIDAELVNGLSVNFAYTSNETRSINVVSKLLSESVGKEVIGGFGIVLQDIQIGFLQGRQRSREPATPPTLNNRQGGGNSRSGGRLNVSDMDIQFNFSLRESKTYASRLLPPTREIIEGSRIFTLAPSVEYQLNQRLSLRGFFDYRKTTPFNPLGFPQTAASGGIVVRFQLN